MDLNNITWLIDILSGQLADIRGELSGLLAALGKLQAAIDTIVSFVS